MGGCRRGRHMIVCAYVWVWVVRGGGGAAGLCPHMRLREKLGSLKAWSARLVKLYVPLTTYAATAASRSMTARGGGEEVRAVAIQSGWGRWDACECALVCVRGGGGGGRPIYARTVGDGALSGRGQVTQCLGHKGHPKSQENLGPLPQVAVQHP